MFWIGPGTSSSSCIPLKSATGERGARSGTHLSHELRHTPPQVLPDQTISVRIPTFNSGNIPHISGIVILEVFWEVLGIEIVVELDEEVESLGDLKDGDVCGERGGGVVGEDFIDSLVRRMKCINTHDSG